MRYFLLLPLCALSLAFAPAPPPKPARPTAADADLKAMQGRWVRTSFDFGDIRMGAGDGSIRVRGDRVAFYLGTRLRDEWTITLKPEKGRKRFKARAISGDHKGRTVRGIYRIDGDVLTLSHAETVGPGGFGLCPPKQVTIVLTYKRRTKSVP
jgi:uncharacterized protein (TIGR03067 family)